MGSCKKVRGSESDEDDIIRVTIVEDDERFRQSLALLIGGTEGMACVSVYADGESAEAGLAEDGPDVVMLDIQLPGMSGIEFLRRAQALLAKAQVIMLTAYQDDERIFESLAAGATGYLLKRTPPGAILEAVREVYEGGSPMSSSIARRVVRSFAGGGQPGQVSGTTDGVMLSPRENEVLALLAQGFLYKEIAATLGISLDTVRTHLRRIYEKLQVHTRTEAVVTYLRGRPQGGGVGARDE